MKITHFIEEYLQQVMVLQIATSAHNVPWICTVCFAYDSEFNLYWFSRHNTRHSQEIEKNPHIAGAVAIPYALGDKSRGLQIDGTARELSDEESIVKGLAVLKKRYHVEEKRIKHIKEELLQQSADYGLYQLQPDSILLYDTLHFPESPRQVYTAVRKETASPHAQEHQ